MEPGRVISDSWDLYRSHFGHLVTVAAVVFVPLGALTALLGELGLGGVVAANALNIVGTFLVQGAVVTTVARVSARREPPGVGGALTAAGVRVVPLVAAGLLATAGILLGLALVIVPGLVLLTWWAVVPQVIMLESPRIIPSFGRSHRLVTGSGWPVFGVVVVTVLVVLAINTALVLALMPVGGFLSGFLVTAVGNTLAAPFTGVALTLTYLRLREIEADRLGDGGASGYTPAP